MPTRLALALLLTLAGCRPVGQGVIPPDLATRPIRVVATTGMVADMVREVGGPRVAVRALMGPGVDPHLYKASEGDVLRMAEADLVVYSGLHLEGRMADLFERMGALGRRTLAVTDAMPPERLHDAPGTPGVHDPHVWFDVSLWRASAPLVARTLAALDPAHAADYARRADAYGARLDALDRDVAAEILRVPEPNRVLVTAHDAFGYFGARYGVRVVGLQGISTAAEAGTADVQRLAERLTRERIPAIFVESSVPRRTLDAVVAAVRARGGTIRIGGSLYSDALGSPGSGADTYEGMVRTNVRTITSALGAVPVVARPPAGTTTQTQRAASSR